MQVPSAAPLAGAHPGARRDAFPLAVVTTLFFMWGAITALNDILIPHLLTSSATAGQAGAFV